MTTYQLKSDITSIKQQTVCSSSLCHSHPTAQMVLNCMQHSPSAGTCRQPMRNTTRVVEPCRFSHGMTSHELRFGFSVSPPRPCAATAVAAYLVAQALQRTLKSLQLITFEFWIQ